MLAVMFTRFDPELTSRIGLPSQILHRERKEVRDGGSDKASGLLQRSRFMGDSEADERRVLFAAHYAPVWTSAIFSPTISESG